jgi:hypothetical protein
VEGAGTAGSFLLLVASTEMPPRATKAADNKIFLMFIIVLIDISCIGIYRFLQRYIKVFNI